MEILLWLVPPVVVTVVAMAWVGWVGREGRGQVDREEAVRRLGAALERTPKALTQGRTTRQRPARPQERSTGVALRRSQPGERYAAERAAEQTHEQTHDQTREQTPDRGPEQARPATPQPRRGGGDQERRAS